MVLADDCNQRDFGGVGFFVGRNFGQVEVLSFNFLEVDR
jgi:hypothetical protein